MHAILYYTEHINILWMGQRNHAPGRVAIGIPMKHCKSWDPSVRACSATLGRHLKDFLRRGLTIRTKTTKNCRMISHGQAPKKKTDSESFQHDIYIYVYIYTHTFIKHILNMTHFAGPYEINKCTSSLTYTLIPTSDSVAGSTRGTGNTWSDEIWRFKTPTGQDLNPKIKIDTCGLGPRTTSIENWL